MHSNAVTLLGYISSFGQCKKETWRVFTMMDRSKRGKWTAFQCPWYCTAAYSGQESNRNLHNLLSD
jgi:hypothetical protein